MSAVVRLHRLYLCLLSIPPAFLPLSLPIPSLSPLRTSSPSLYSLSLSLSVPPLRAPSPSLYSLSSPCSLDEWVDSL